MEKQEKFYIGYELNNRYAQITYFREGMKEPVSLKEKGLVVEATEKSRETLQHTQANTRIETVISRESANHPWVIGNEAEALNSHRFMKIYHLYPRAIKKEECEFQGKTVSLVDLLTEFVKESLRMIPELLDVSMIRRITFSVEKVDLSVRFLIKQMMERIGIPWKRVILVDHKESFFCFVFAKKMDIWNQEVCHFEYQQGVMKCTILEKDESMKPVIVRAREKAYQQFTSLELGDYKEPDSVVELKKDETFYEIIDDIFKKRNISYIFLSGDGFDGEWMKKSRNYICRNHKVYRGTNLYAKGACYRSLFPQEEGRLGCLYFGENKVQINAGLHLEVGGKEEIRHLISIGENWFDMERECEVILKREPYIELTFQFIEEKEERVERLQLEDFPVRPKNTSRLKIQVIPYSSEQAKLRISDLGFGELFPRTEKVWEFMIPIKKYFRGIQDIK